MGNWAFDDNGNRIQAVDFDYGLVSLRLGEHQKEPVDEPPVIEYHRDLAKTALQNVVGWIWQDFTPGRSDPNGLIIRSAIASRKLLPNLQNQSMRGIAQNFGMDKQSFGRWVARWNRKFGKL